MTEVHSNHLQRLNAALPEGWEARLAAEQGRIYYLNHNSQVSSWIPPLEHWDPGTGGQPYGWECAIDKNDKQYYINHLEKYTTRDDPRDDPDYVEPPKPREITLNRDPQKGFGFVAGSEKPVVVRFVTDGGPSVDKLLPGDQIIKINGEDVKNSPREYVIDLVRSCKVSISLTVCQPYSDNSTKKSSLLTAAKKARLKSNPSRVRFSENVTVTMVNGAPLQNANSDESYIPFMPNVLKVFLENGQTKSFKYDNKTTVKDVVQSLKEKLNIKCVQHFNLVLQNMKSHSPSHMTLLQEQDTLAEIAAKPGARHFRCLFRVMFVPIDAYDLLKEDPVAFEYFYMQCCNDVVNERFPELKGELVYKLAALHIQQHVMSNNNVASKINIKAIEKECGMEKFVPYSHLEHLKPKELRKILAQQMKMNQNLTPPGQKQLSSMQAKLHYMKIVSELKTFGSRIFMVTLLDKMTEAMILVGPKSGIGLITNIKLYTLSVLAEFDQIQKIKVAKEKDNIQKVEITIKSDNQEGMLNFGLLKDEAMNFVAMVEGYYRIFVDDNVCLVEKPASKQSSDPDVPPYFGTHRVSASPWSYPEDVVTHVIQADHDSTEIAENERIVNFARGPPVYDGSDSNFITKIKEDLGIQPKNSEVNEGVISLVKDSEQSDTSPKHVNKSVIVIGSDPNDIQEYLAAKERKAPIKRPETQEQLTPPNTKKPKTDKTPQTVVSNGEIFGDDKVHSTVNEEESSDTDSGVESEKKVPLDDYSPQGGRGQELESSDTDSWGTPANSPAKDADPETELPRTESDFEVIASSFGLLSPDKIPPEIQEGILNPKMFSERRLYLDPDIIDLTLMPPPPPPPTSEPPELDQQASMKLWQFSSTPEESQTLETAEVIRPRDEGPHPVTPPFERSVSDGATPDFFDSDIDQLIAQLTIPPPPSSEDSMEHIDHLAHTWSGPETVHSAEEEFSVEAFEEGLESLVIPPPPGEASVSLDQIPIVPPVTGISEDGENMNSRLSHRRSNSMDTLCFKVSKDEHNNNDVRKSGEKGGDLKSESGALSDTKAIASENEAGNSRKSDCRTESEKTTSNVKDSQESDSPGSVSEKLNTLLQMIPNLGPKLENENDYKWRRTSSLRLSKPSPMYDKDKANLPNGIVKTDLTSGKLVKMHSVDAPSQVEKSSQEVRQTKGDVTVSSKYSRHLRRTNSFDILPKEEEVGEEPEKAVTESFSSLKAKLQSYRDYLLNKSNNSKKERKTEEKKEDGPLRRSNSFTLNYLRRRNSSSDSDDQKSGNDVVLNRSRRRDRKSKNKDDKEDKKTPALWNQLAAPRSFRPHTSTTTQEADTPTPSGGEEKSSGLRKSGPLKALSSVFTSSSPTSTPSPSSSPISSEQALTQTAPVIPSKTQEPVATTESKDDISLALQPQKRPKENPFGTVSNMWRPMSMSKSSIRQTDSEETNFRVYNNFDALRDMSSGKTPPKEETVIVTQGKSKPQVISTGVTRERKGSLSEESHAVVRDSISVSHSDSVKQIMSRTYKAEEFGSATKDADRLLSELKQTMETLKDSRIDRKSTQFDMCKGELTNQVKNFVMDVKCLVSNASQTKEKMAVNLNNSMHTLARIFLHTQATMIMMEAIHQAQHLGFEVIKMTNAYKSTVNAAQAAVGKPITDPHMRYLMRQATNLAQLISGLLKSLKALEQK
ncbi:uncharacterized protein LOC133173697 isoform X4 [Saccostrea echinata]|uniref:uncharacterized protein LOC133173697 isoform X4 n=1 Tax=Saccostrea echinata TaxID=191078 RepID=UPI002A8140CA|nr:uncharacterized protein LOC133173697 isoform X4 [Saccostrea echinata]